MEPSITQEQIILARSRLWTPELDKLLRRWRTQVGKREQGHLAQTRIFSRRHYIFGAPAVILAAITTAGIFATFQSCPEEDCAAEEWIRIATGVISMFSGGLTAFTAFMNYSDVAGDHKKAADEYGRLYRSLDSTLLTPGPLRGDPQSSLQDIRNQYDDIVRKAPTLPTKYDVSLNYEVMDKTKLPAPPKPGMLRHDNSMENATIPPGPKHVNSTKDLQMLLVESGTDSSGSTFVDIDKVMAEQNNYNTSDDEQEVHITFDLDEAPCYNAKTAAIAAAQLATRQERRVQDSLMAALQFEMNRMDSHSGRTPVLVSRKKPKKDRVDNEKNSPNQNASDDDKDE